MKTTGLMRTTKRRASLPRFLIARGAPVGRLGNRRTPYGGRTYASKAEAHHAQTLDLLKRAGIVEFWTPQVRLPLLIDGKHLCYYVADFHVGYCNGLEEIVEVKGHWTDYAKLKRRVFELTWLADRPFVRFVVVHRQRTTLVRDGELRVPAAAQLAFEAGA